MSFLSRRSCPEIYRLPMVDPATFGDLPAFSAGDLHTCVVTRQDVIL